MYIPYTLMRDAHRQRLEDAGVIETKRPDPVVLFRRNPNARNEAGSLRVRLLALTSLFTR